MMLISLVYRDSDHRTKLVDSSYRKVGGWMCGWHDGYFGHGLHV